MIVTCPACSARYKIDASKIPARGAKITCPKCAHRFVVYPEGSDAPADDAKPAPRASGAPDDLDERDFREVGITWRVRKSIGLTYDFHDLATLREYMDDGQIDEMDALTYDLQKWTPIEELGDLEAHFWDVWQRAERGEVKSPAAAPKAAVPSDDDEDESDAPTTIVGQGTSLADEIRRAVQEATTPAPAAERSSRPPASAEPPASAPAGQPEAHAPAEPVRSRPTDPFTRLERKERDTGGSGMAMALMLALVLGVLLVVVLWVLGVFGGGPLSDELPGEARAVPVEQVAPDDEQEEAHEDDGAPTDEQPDVARHE